MTKLIKKLILKWRTRKIHIKNDDDTMFIVHFKKGLNMPIGVADLISIKGSMEAKRKTAYIFDESRNSIISIYIKNIRKIVQYNG